MPMPRNKKEDIWKYVSNYGDYSKCWEWQRSTSRGYGQFRLDGKYRKTHQIAYELAKGSIEGLYVCHSCDNKLCCNPKHLWLGTNADNQLDAVKKGRSFPTGEDCSAAKLTEDQIYRIFDLRNKGMSQGDISKLFGVNSRHISRILGGKRWTYLKVTKPIKFLALKRGEAHPNSKITDRHVEEIFKLRKLGMSHKKIADKFGISRTHIGRILNGKSRASTAPTRGSTRS
jgi:transcriptional regulator